MRTNQGAQDPLAAPSQSPHVLVLPKWWPGPADPQLGDFIRKQTQAAAQFTKLTVLLVRPVQEIGTAPNVILRVEDDLTTVSSTYASSSNVIKPVRKVINLMRYWRAAKKGWNHVVQQQGLPDLVHVHILVRPALFARWINRKYGIPYLISEQSSEYLDGTYTGKGFLFHQLNKHLFRHAALITAVSARLGEGVRDLGLCKEFKVVPNVIPGLDRPLPPRGDKGHFLVVADLVDRTKNVSGVLRALHKALAIEPGLRLTVIGDGPDRAELEAMVRSLELSAQVEFLGRLPNLAVLDHMALVGSVIINSNVETFSVVTGEALAQGKPVIATRCGGPEAFITPTNGLLIPLRDDASLAEAMIRSNTTHGTYLPAAIRQSLASRFSPTAVGSAFLECYRSCLNA